MRRSNRHRRWFTQRGVALIFVTMALALLATATAQFTTEATIDFEAAVNARDDMRAHFLARSGMNLSRLVITVQTDVLDQYRKYIGDIQLADYLPLFMGAFGGSKEDVAFMAEALGGMPADEVKGLGLEEGRFDLTVTTDDGKINMNCARLSGTGLDALRTRLEALVFSEAYDPIFQYEDAEGWRRDRATQVSALIDYVDPDNARDGAPGTPEDYGYESLTKRYDPKNNYIDSVGELKLVRGVDDRFWTLFGDAFTVYGSCKQNVGALQDVNVIAAIIYVSAKDRDDPVLRDPRKLWALASFVAQARMLGILFDDRQAFADFVKDPAAIFGDLLGQDPSLGGNAGLPGGLPEGVELDPSLLAQVAEEGPRRTYRVEATAEVGRVTKRITAVWDKNITRQNVRPPDMGLGAWVFWREE